MNLNEKIEQVIEKEIKQGYMKIAEDDMMSSYISLEDMELMSLYLKDVLKKQLVKFPTPKEYREKIKELFDVEFDGKSTILYDQGIGEIEPKTVLVAGSEMSGSIFLSNKGFITLPLRLPELINYQKHFPHLVKLEDEMEKSLEEEIGSLDLWREKNHIALTTNYTYEQKAIESYLTNFSEEELLELKPPIDIKTALDEFELPFFKKDLSKEHIHYKTEGVI